VKPKVVFPIHDAMYTEAYKETSVPRWVGTQLAGEGIGFVYIPDHSSHTF